MIYVCDQHEKDRSRIGAINVERYSDDNNRANDRAMCSLSGPSANCSVHSRHAHDAARPAPCGG
eukprot:8993415-Lingulodinium_polyedra.AAC.1